jgi:hypothetical protein
MPTVYLSFASPDDVEPTLAALRDFIEHVPHAELQESDEYARLVIDDDHDHHETDLGRAREIVRGALERTDLRVDRVLCSDDVKPKCSVAPS